MRKLGWFAVLLLGACAPKPQSGALVPVTLAVGGQAQIIYSPATLALDLGFYEQEGLKVTIQDFQGGQKSLEALLGGSADVVCGFYDHVIHLAAQGQKLQAIALIQRFPGGVVAVSPAASRPVPSLASLKGARIGVTTPGSSSHMIFQAILARTGVQPEDVTPVAIGSAATAVAAMERGSVDAAILFEPTASALKARFPGLKILAETTTSEGVQAALGVPEYPAAAIYAKQEWLRAHSDTAGRMARAIARTLAWIQAQPPAAIAARIRPEFRAGGVELYTRAYGASLPMFSPDGRMTLAGAEAVRDVLGRATKAVREAPIDLNGTFTTAFLPTAASQTPGH